MYVLETFLDNCALTSSRGATHHPSFVVEVAEDDEDSSALGAQGIFDRDFDVFKRDVCSAGGRRVTGLDRFRLYTFPTLDEYNSETICSPTSDGETRSFRQKILPWSNQCNSLI